MRSKQRRNTASHNLTDRFVPRDEITGVILAGGRARRMGGRDKGLITIGGRAMVEHVIDALRPQVGTLLISANRNPRAYGRYGYPVVPDGVGDFSGPLAGMATAMQRAGTPFIVTVPCDSPLLPEHLVARLYATLIEHGAEISVAYDGQRIQPVFALLRRSLLENLIGFLNAGHRRVEHWYSQHETAPTDFSDNSETFFNVNTPEDGIALEERLQSHASKRGNGPRSVR